MKAPLFILLCIVSVPAISQDDSALTPPRALFKTMPQSFMVRTLKVGVEVFNKSRTKSYSLFATGRLSSNNGAPVFSTMMTLIKALVQSFSIASI